MKVDKLKAKRVKYMHAKYTENKVHACKVYREYSTCMI